MRILFQGDSITDASRQRNVSTNMGLGYAMLTKASLAFDEPGKYEFFNRGISGNRIVDLYARIKADILYLKPDVMSILIGVNDVWHDFEPAPNGVDADKFYRIYDMLIEEVLAELPDIKIIIMEPFALKNPALEAHWDTFRYELEKRAAMARKIAKKYGFPFIELQKDFDELSKDTGTEYWLYDGVHPSVVGHEFIKRKWIATFKAL